MSLQPRIFGGPIQIKGLTNYGTCYLDNSGQVQTVSPGTSGQVLTSNGSSAAPSFQAISAPQIFVPTLTTCNATTAETTIASFTIAANGWADGQILLWLSAPFIYNFGLTNYNLTLKVYVGSTSFTLLSSVNVPVSENAFAPTLLSFFRNGTTVYLNYRGSTSTSVFNFGSFASVAGMSDSYVQVFSPTFTSSITMKITAQWSSTDSGLYAQLYASRALLF